MLILAQIEYTVFVDCPSKVFAKVLKEAYLAAIYQYQEPDKLPLVVIIRSGKTAFKIPTWQILEITQSINMMKKESNELPLATEILKGIFTSC